MEYTHRHKKYSHPCTQCGENIIPLKQYMLKKVGTWEETEKADLAICILCDFENKSKMIRENFKKGLY